MQNNQEYQADRKKIGLALGGGAARGLAHIGVIKALERAEVPIDFIAGTSMGALVGGWYAATGNIFAMEKLFLSLKGKDIFSQDEAVEKKDGTLFSDKSIVEILETAFGDKKFSDCKIPFAAVATDVENGDEVILKEGKLVDAVRASSTVPIIFKPVRIDHRLLMDGCFANPVPADVVGDMGADFVIAVDVASRWINLPSDDLQDLVKDSKNLFSFMHELVSAAGYHIVRRVTEKSDIVIKVPLQTIDWLEFNRAAEIIERGENEAKKYLKDIAEKTGYEAKIQKTPLESFVDFWFKN